MEGVGFGFGFGLGIGRKELLINCLVLVRWVGWVQVFNVLVLVPPVGVGGFGTVVLVIGEREI